MLTIRMDESARRHLTASSAVPALLDEDHLSDGLRLRLACGAELRDGVLVWAGQPPVPAWEPTPSHPDLTGWECWLSSFHLEDEVDTGPRVPGHDTFGDPYECVSPHDQRRLLVQGVSFAACLLGRLDGAFPRTSVRCTVSVNHSNGTFRLHQVRAGERWAAYDLDGYSAGHPDGGTVEVET